MPCASAIPIRFLLTTFTVTSARIASNRLPEGAVHQFAPLDSPRFVRRFLDYWQPELAAFTESEIWPNLILDTHARGIPLVLVNARMSPRSFRSWRKRPGMSRPLFSRFDMILAQDRTLARRFEQTGAHTVLALGNLKADAPAPPVDELCANSWRMRFVAARSCWPRAPIPAKTKLSPKRLKSCAGACPAF